MPLCFSVTIQPSGRIINVDCPDGRATSLARFVELLCRLVECTPADLHLETADGITIDTVSRFQDMKGLNRYAMENNGKGFRAWDKKAVSEAKRVAEAEAEARRVAEVQRIEAAKLAAEAEAKRVAAEVLAVRTKLIEAVRTEASKHHIYLDKTSFVVEEKEEELLTSPSPCLMWAIQRRAPCDHLVLGGIHLRPLVVSMDGLGVDLGSRIVSFRCAPPELIAEFDENQAICKERLQNAQRLTARELPDSLAVSRARFTELQALVERDEHTADLDLSEFGCLVVEQARIKRELATQAALVASLTKQLAEPIDASRFTTRRVRLGVHVPFGLHNADEPADVLVCPSHAAAFTCAFPGTPPLVLSLRDA
jgi:hypothetical protein